MTTDTIFASRDAFLVIARSCDFGLRMTHERKIVPTRTEAEACKSRWEKLYAKQPNLNITIHECLV